MQQLSNIYTAPRGGFQVEIWKKCEPGDILVKFFKTWEEFDLTVQVLFIVFPKSKSIWKPPKTMCHHSYQSCETKDSQAVTRDDFIL